MRKAFALVLLCTFLSLPAWAGLITVGTADPGSVGALSADSSDVLAAAWYLPGSYSSVGISIQFEDLFGGGTFSAYLMDGIGPQADPLANEIENTTFTAGPDLATVQLWQGLVLDPGFYYLVVGTTDANSFGGWGATTNPTVTLAPGVMQGDLSGVQFYASGGDVNAAYLPASNFAVDSDLAFGQLMYDVSVPEPSTALLLLGGGLLLAIRKLRGGNR
jgi:hypothetical protein